MPVMALHREQVIETDRWLTEAWQQCAPWEEALHALDDRFRELTQLEQSLEDFADLDIDLGRLQGEHAHLDLRIGAIPADNLARLRDILLLSDHLILNVAGEGEGETLRLLVAGRKESADVLDSVLHAAAFQPLTIPKSFDDDPETLRRELHDRRLQLEQEQAQIRLQMTNWVDSNRDQLLHARQLLEAAEPYVNVRSAARSRGPLAALQGWMPDSSLETVQKKLSESLALPFVLESRRPRNDEKHLVPVPESGNGGIAPLRLAGAAIRGTAVRRVRSHHTVRRHLRGNVRHDVRRCRDMARSSSFWG